jgi:AraC-like DNA-binding protein
VALEREHRLEVPAPLRGCVTGIGFARSDGASRRAGFFPPRAEASILVRWSPKGEAVVNVLGPLTRARRKSFDTPQLYVRVGLHAGRARALLGVPIHEIADRVVPIEHLWDGTGSQLRDSLASCDLARAVERFEAAIVQRLRSAKAPTMREELVVRAMRTLDDGAGEVGSAARSIGLSDRQLRRLFQDDLGMTPKHYARIARLRRVLAGWPSSSWARLALEAGFHDQSHLIREFRDLLQVTPSTFCRNESQARRSRLPVRSPL